MNIPQMLMRISDQLAALSAKPGLQNDDKATIAAIKKAAQDKLMLVEVP